MTYIDDGTRLSDKNVPEFIPVLFDAMMQTHLKTVVDAYCPNGLGAKKFSKLTRKISKIKRNNPLVPYEPITVSLSRYIEDGIGIKIRVKLMCIQDTFTTHPDILYNYTCSMCIIDTNLTGSHQFTTGKRRALEKGIGYTWFIGKAREYDGSIPFTQFLVESLSIFNTNAVEIDNRMDGVKKVYAEMKKAVDRF